MELDFRGGTSTEELESVAPEELIRLCAVDGLLFGRHFFPNVFRQEPAPFHRELWNKLRSNNRRLAAAMFRGSAKTSLLRAYVLWRISYGLSSTILFVSASEDSAKASVEWIRKQINFNEGLKTIYGLAKGEPWSIEKIVVHNKSLGTSSTILALGFSGQLRGYNEDGMRPDLIIIDDIEDEESAASLIQREKTKALITGALDKSLVQPVDNPVAKIVMLQTPLHPDDALSKFLLDPGWDSMVVGCFNDLHESTWPARFTTKFLLEEEQHHIKANNYPVFLREMRCLHSSSETSEFKASNIKYWEELPEYMPCVLTIDPVPPPTDIAVQRNLHKRDYEVLCVTGFYKGHYYHLAFEANRGHTPDWTVAKFFELMLKWKPIRVGIETVQYQATLKWLIEEAMRKRGIYAPITPIKDKRSKLHRITQAYGGITAHQKLKIHSSMTEWLAQFVAYPKVEHDDFLDAGAMGVSLLDNYAAMEDSLMDPMDNYSEYMRTKPVAGNAP